MRTGGDPRGQRSCTELGAIDTTDQLDERFVHFECFKTYQRSAVRDCIAENQFIRFHIDVIRNINYVLLCQYKNSLKHGHLAGAVSITYSHALYNVQATSP